MTQNNKMHVIGLTGSMGSGKSTVAHILGGCGIAVIDADEIARRVVRKGTMTLAFIVQTFGQQIIGENGELNRKALAEIVFSDTSQLSKLEAITHPAVLSEIIRDMVKCRAEGKAVVVLDIPLLFENDYDVLCDETWVVSVSPEVRIKRLQARDNLAASQISARLNEQMPQEQKIARADVIIDNDGSLEDLKAKVLRAIKFK